MQALRVQDNAMPEGKRNEGLWATTCGSQLLFGQNKERTGPQVWTR